MLCQFRKVFLSGDAHLLNHFEILLIKEILRFIGKLVDRLTVLIVAVELIEIEIIVGGLAHRLPGYGHAVVGGGCVSLEYRGADELVAGSGHAHVVYEKMSGTGNLYAGVVVCGVVVKYDLHLTPSLVRIDRFGDKICRIILVAGAEVEKTVVVICSSAHHHRGGCEMPFLHLAVLILLFPFRIEGLAEESEGDCAGVVHLRSPDVGRILGVGVVESGGSAGHAYVVASPLGAVGELGVDKLTVVVACESVVPFRLIVGSSVEELEVLVDYYVSHADTDLFFR